MTGLPSLRDSLRSRLLAGTLVWIIASIALAGWGLAGLFRQHVENQLQRDLRARLDQLTASLADTEATPTLSALPGDPRLSRPYGGLYWQIDRLGVGSAGLGLLRSRSLWDANLPMPADAPADGDVHRHRVIGPRGTPVIALERVVIPEGHPEHPLRLTMAVEESDLEEPIARFGRELWMALAILGLGLVTAAVVQVLVGLAPLRRLQRTLAAIRQGLAQQLDGHFPQEVRPLVDDFNAVLAQNTAMTARARTQAGNLAHALKTPLTVLAGFLETLQEIDLEAYERQHYLQLMQEQSERMQRIVRDLLTLSSLEAAPPPENETIDMATLLDKLKRDAEALSGGRHTIVLVAEGGDLRGAEGELVSAMGNLVSNAVRYTPEGGIVTISWRTGAEGGEFAVHDTGIGIDPKHIPRLTERFYRVDRGRSRDTGGTGLGLAIVKHALSRHQATLDITSTPGKGSRFAAKFPPARIVA